jgi:hypothetical protein
MPSSSEQPWYRDPIKVVTLLTLLVGLPIGVKALYDNFLKPEPAAVSVQYVLDASSGMAGKIGGEQKLAAATDEIVSAVGGMPEIAYALRLAGPGCSTGYEQPRVDFGQDNAEDFGTALASVEPHGTSDIARSVRYAVSDIVDRQSDKDTKSASLFFVLGASDGCVKRPEKVIGDSLSFLDRQKTIDVNFKFVGVKAPQDLRRQLGLVSRRATQLGFGATVEFADTPAELGETLDHSGPSPPSP